MDPTVCLCYALTKPKRRQILYAIKSFEKNAFIVDLLFQIKTIGEFAILIGDSDSRIHI